MIELATAHISVLLLCCSVVACHNSRDGQSRSDGNSSTVVHFVEVKQKVDAGEVVDAVLFDSDLYTNARSAEVDPETREKYARAELADGLKLTSLVVLATVVDPDSEILIASEPNGKRRFPRKVVIASVEEVLSGSRSPERLFVDRNQFPSTVDPIVYPYHVHYAKGRKYYFFLKAAEELSKLSTEVIYSPILSVPKQQ